MLFKSASGFITKSQCKDRGWKIRLQENETE